MKILTFPDAAYIVTKAPVTFHNGVSSANLTLTGTWPANGSKIAITASAITGHADCSGTLVINGTETITFTQAGRKTNTVNLTARPAITTSNLDCNLLITCLDSGLAPIETETAAATKIQFENTSSGFFNSQGVWTVYSGSYALCKDAAIVSDVLRYGSDMIIKKVDVEKWFSKILYYIFYL